jgi:hypothetical protein
VNGDLLVSGKPTVFPYEHPQPPDNRQFLFDILPALIIGLGSFVLYLATLAPTVLFADGGEFQFVPYILGIAHPTGYPLYLLLGWAWSHALPFGDVAYRMNLFSALWAALAVGLSYPLALRVVRLGALAINPLAARLAAATATASFAVGQTFWSQSIIAEVYSFNAFFVALILLLLLRLAGHAQAEEAPPPRYLPRIGHFARRSLVLAFVFGLSLTHHVTMLLLLPGVLLFLWFTYRPARAVSANHQASVEDLPWGRRMAAPETRPLSLFAPRSLLRRAGFALALLLALALPLLLYLYLPLRAPHTPYANLPLSDTQTLTLYANTWRGFLDHLAATVFASNLALPAARPDVAIAWGQRLAMMWGLLRDQIGLAGVGLALLGLGRLAVGRRWALLALTGLGYAVGVAFNLAYAIGDIQVLFIPSYLLVSLWLGLGVATLAQGLAAGLLRWKGSAVNYGDFGQQGYRRLAQGISRLTAQGVAALTLALPLVLLVNHFPLVDQSANTAARDTWQAILAQPVPPGAVLLSNDRNEMMPLWYYQYVEGRRPDLLGLFPLVVSDPTYSNIGGLIDQALLSQRPVYLIKAMPGLEIKAQLEPAADMPPLVRVVGPAMERPPLHPREVALAGVMRLVGYDLSPSSARPGEKLTVTLYWQPQSEIKFDYSSYVHLVDEEGRGITQSDLQPGGDYYPTSLWRPGEVLRDHHVLTISPDVAPGVYRLVVGMYRHPSLEPLGGPADVGLLAVKEPDSVKMALPSNGENAAATVRKTEVEFGGRIMLLGYDPQLLDDELQLTLYWQAERPMDQNWTVFVHVLDSAGTLVAQHDGQPRDGRYPTSVWDQGEVVDDGHRLSLPGDLPDGDYQVVVGLYSVESGERLPVLDSQGNPSGDSVPLATLALADGKWQIK